MENNIRSLKKRKAQTEVITTVLLILIGIVAIGLVSMFVINLVRDNLKSSDCFKTQGQISLNSGSLTYFNSSNKLLYLNMQRGSNEFNLTGVTVSAGTEGILKAIIISAGSSGAFATSGISLFDGSSILSTAISLPAKAEKLTYVINVTKFGLTSVNQVSISPILSGGVTCDLSDSIQVPVY